MHLRQPGIIWILGILMACGRGQGGLEVSLVPPSSPMPVPGSSVRLTVRVKADGPVTIHWLRNGVIIPGARAAEFTLPQVVLEDAGAFQAQVSDGAQTLVTEPVVLEPADRVFTVDSAEDDGPGTLREALAKAQADGFPGLSGILFRLPGPGPSVIRLARDLPPTTANLVILGSFSHPVTLDGGGVRRPFFVQGGSLVLDLFTVAHGLGKGGNGPGGGGGAAGMGGAMFINGGQVVLRRMTFRDNQALGGDSGFGSDGENGGGGGFGGDAPRAGGNGADGGFLAGEGGLGSLAGLPADDPEGGGPPTGDGAGAGAARGAPLATFIGTWAHNLPGGNGDTSFGGGGGFSVGPEGGGGDGAFFGGGGGGSGGYVPVYLTPTPRPGETPSWVLFNGSGSGEGGFCGGQGSKASLGLTGRGGGGAGAGGAIFLRDGTLDLFQCRFERNRAQGGLGAQRGLGKGGAIFIYKCDPDRSPPTAVAYEALCKAQSYVGNFTQDKLEEPAFDNDNYYIAQTPITLNLDPALKRRYERYRLGLREGESAPLGPWLW